MQHACSHAAVGWGLNLGSNEAVTAILPLVDDLQLPASLFSEDVEVVTHLFNLQHATVQSHLAAYCQRGSSC